MARLRLILSVCLLGVLALALTLPATIAQTPTPNVETQVWQEFTQTAQMAASPNFTATLEALRTQAVMTLTAAAITPTPATMPERVGTASVFAVTLVENNRAGDIYLVDSSDGSLIGLLDYADQGDFSPTWSPDGTQLAYQSIRGEINGIFVRDMPTGSEWQITDGAEMRPVWSPDGAWIAMEGIDGEEVDMFVVAAGCYRQNACIPQNLTMDRAIDAGARWSPDSTRLAYLTDQGLRQGVSIFLVNVDGSNKRPLLDLDIKARDPVWSPDGTRLAYSADGDIYTANATCTQPISTDANGAVYGCATDIRRLTDTGDVNLPAWSPDGTRLAYVSGGGYELSIMNTDGSGPFVLLQQPVPITDLSWSPDGTQMAFVTGVGDLHLTDVSSGVPRTLVTERVHLASRLVWQPGG